MMLAITMRARIPNMLFMWWTMLLGVNKLYPGSEDENGERKPTSEQLRQPIPGSRIFS
jgi:hypothetical protein